MPLPLMPAPADAMFAAAAAIISLFSCHMPSFRYAVIIFI